MFNACATNCVFLSNCCTNFGGACAKVTAVDCAFTNNFSSGNRGGAMSNGRAVGCTFHNNFTKNTSARGGACSHTHCVRSRFSGVGDVSGGSFLDMGCGSGILSIAAAKLGFSPVAGFDIDEDAVNASRENAALNGVSVDYRLFALGKGAVTLDESIEASKVLYPDLALQGRDVGSSATPFAPADIVVANILGPLLIAFAEEIASYAKKTLIVSGILNELYPEVLGAFAALGFSEVSRKTIGEWTTGYLCRA